MDENLKDYLKEKHPGSFEGWDGFEFSVQTRMRKDEKPQILVTLYNEAEGEYIVDIHACFLLSEGDDGKEIIRAGKGELYMEYKGAYTPEFAK